MSNPLSTETILGLPVEETYKVLETTLPNGKIFKQLFQRVRTQNGIEDWQLVDEKLKHLMIDLVILLQFLITGKLLVQKF